MASASGERLPESTAGGSPSKRSNNLTPTPPDPNSGGIIQSQMSDTIGYKVFSDSVHGQISLHPLLVKVIDTLEFQRLRNLKQLGLACFVYPAANHSRFEHSLGTCHLAGHMVEILLEREKLLKNVRLRGKEEIKKLKLCVELAALCHDLGHGPFSHTWEVVVNRGQWGPKNWKHEEASKIFFDLIYEKRESDFKEYKIEEKEKSFIQNLIMGNPNDEKDKQNYFLYEIVSNSKTGIDVDKWDYFLRDGQHLNLRISFDYCRILELCTVMDIGDPGECKTTIAFRDNTLSNLYDMYRVRSDLHYRAYRHRVVVNIELMLVDAFLLAGDFKLNDVSLKEAHKDPKYFKLMTDHIFYDILCCEKNQGENVRKAQQLLLRILERRLYTLVGCFNFEVPDKEERQEPRRKQYVSDTASKLEKELGGEYRVSQFYLDLDLENDPISAGTFYKKKENGEHLLANETVFKESRDAMAPVPFQLVKKAPFQLLIFHTKEKKDLEGEIEVYVNKKIDELKLKRIEDST